MVSRSFPIKQQQGCFTVAASVITPQNYICWGRQLHYSDKMTYLGIMFSKRLSWTDHIGSRVRKCTFF